MNWIALWVALVCCVIIGYITSFTLLEAECTRHGYPRAFVTWDMTRYCQDIHTSVPLRELRRK